MENVLPVCLDTLTVAISFVCLFFINEKLEDIQMILQLSECLSATNICEQNTFPACYLCLCNSTVISTRLVYLHGQSLKNGEILDMLICTTTNR